MSVTLEIEVTVQIDASEAAFAESSSPGKTVLSSVTLSVYLWQYGQIIELIISLLLDLK